MQIRAFKCTYLYPLDTTDDTKKQTVMKYPTLKVVFDRKKLATKEKKGLIQIEVMYDGKRKWISTGIKLYAGQWKDKCMVCMRADAMTLNDQINTTVNNIREWTNGLYKNGEVFSFEKFEKMMNQVSSPDSFILFAETRISERKLKKDTRRQHFTMLRTLQEFGLIQVFSDLTLKNIKLWDDYIKNKVGAQSTVYGYHKRLKVYVKEAYQLDLIKKNPYEGFVIARGESNSRKYLEPDELAKIEKTEINDESISNVRDCFVFCCYTGLAYADIAKFRWKEDVVQKRGKFFIEDVRQKTGSPYKIQILSPAMAILQKHNMVLPVISNQQYNLRLKIVGTYAKVSKTLTSHVARHTFATWALSQGIRIETVSKMLAHADIQTTQIYAKILQREVEDAFDTLEEKLK